MGETEKHWAALEVVVVVVVVFGGRMCWPWRSSG